MESVSSDMATRPSLLACLQNVNDAAAWQTFVGLYAPLVYRYCRRRGVQDADASDITQEVLAQVARALRTFQYQPERGRFRDWLGTVTRHRLFRYQARQDRAVRGAGGDAVWNLDRLVCPEADAEWTAEFNARLLGVALERLRPQFEDLTWQVFTRAWQDNRPAAEVARELSLPIDRVYTAKARVLRRLREEVLLLAEDSSSLFSRS